MVERIKKRVIEQLQARGWTLGFAESCTGGQLSAQAVNEPGVSSIYQGCIVSYSNAVKRNVLGVPESTLKTLGAVSSPVALHMAIGAREVLNTHVALSVTGIAGPAGGTPEKPVGLVYIAVVGPGFEKVERHIFTGSNGETLHRSDIQQETTQRAWNILNEVLQSKI